MQASFKNDLNTRVVYIPPGVAHKKQLFECYKIGLDFPTYFGENWDAFDDFLDDLNWIVEKDIVVVHCDFPSLSIDETIKYWDSLRTAVEFWQSDGSKTFVVIFGHNDHLK
jgi:Barstar (barnase inhibitor)